MTLCSINRSNSVILDYNSDNKKETTAELFSRPQIGPVSDKTLIVINKFNKNQSEIREHTPVSRSQSAPNINDIQKQQHFRDREPYKTKSRLNYIFEKHVGTELKNSKEIRDIAKKIRQLTGSPLQFSEFSVHEKNKITNNKNIGGSAELANDSDTLDAHVLATLHKAERPEYNLGSLDKYDYQNPAGVDIINPPPSEKRKCIFNFAEYKDNVISPWNMHSFDQEIFEVDNLNMIPQNIKDLIADRWNDHLPKLTPGSKELIDLEKHIGPRSHGYDKNIFNLLQELTSAQKKFILNKTLMINWSTTKDIVDEKNNRDINPLGSELRQHTTGGRSNVVNENHKGDLAVTKWVQGAIRNGKPVISGPSGHTLRYLNHYAMCKKMASYNKENDMSQWPSLQEARLVMLANLMPPKDHHSYHEIMLASIGISDGNERLEYQHMSDYDDLKGTSFGEEILENATAIFQASESVVQNEGNETVASDIFGLFPS